MTSPVGHSLGAYLVNRGRYPSLHGEPKNHRLALAVALMLLVFAGNAPDLDFIWGAWKGDMNAYHHGPSHSIVAVFLFAAALLIVARILFIARPPGQWRFLPGSSSAIGLAGAAGFAYASHIALDLVTVDKAAPYGMQLWWPFSDEYVIAPRTFFMNIEHGSLGESAFDVIPAIFTVHNLSAIGFELLILGPPALLMFLWQRAAARKDAAT